MGWWSAEVLGGDTPMDMLIRLERLADIDRDTDGALYVANMSPVTASKLKTYLDENDLGRVALQLGERDQEYVRIASQVVAVVAMAVGATLSDEFIEAVTFAAMTDDWASEETYGGERTDAMASLLDTVKAYTAGVPTQIVYRTHRERIMTTDRG